jgi:hypothetical protein
MPINALQMETWMTPFDDLESIFYILAWIIFGHKQPILKDHRLALDSMEGTLSEWFGKNENYFSATKDVAKAKRDFLTHYSEIQTVREAWYPLLPLLNMYYKLLHERQMVLLQRKKEAHMGLETSREDIIDTFDKVLWYFTLTLESVEMASSLQLQSR